MTVVAKRFTEVSTLSPNDIEPVLDIHIGLRRRLQRKRVAVLCCFFTSQPCI